MEKLTQEVLSNTTQDLMSYDNPRDDPDYKEPSPEEKRMSWLSRAGVTSFDHTFDNLRMVRGQENMVAAFKELLVGSRWFMLMAYGGVGSGKTHCCEATLIELYDNGIMCRRQRWSDIIRHLKAGFGTDYEQRFQRIRDQKILIIDDVGMGSTGGNWEWGELEDMVDYRLEKRLLTIITTNLDLKEIPPRIVSRFRDKSKARLVYCECGDQRPKLQEE